MRPAALLPVLLLALPALAYKRSVNSDNKYLFWATRGHSFQLDAQGTPDVPGTTELDAVRKSFDSWAAVSCSDLAFPEVLPLERDRRVSYFRGETNRNLVLWRTESCATVAPPGDACHTQGGCSNKYDCWDKGSGVIATTTTTSVTSTGEIVDSDIELNDARDPGTQGKFFFTTADAPQCSPGPPAPDCVSIDVQNTVTHEAGHTIGLDHTDEAGATMAAFAPAGEIGKRTLHADDIQGVCDIYPKGGPTSTSPGVPVTTPPDPGGCGCSSRSASWEGLLLTVSLLARRRRRRC